MSLVMVGVDPHKQSHTATALVARSHQQLASLRVPASPSGYQQLLDWARQFPQRRWAVPSGTATWPSTATRRRTCPHRGARAPTRSPSW